MPEVAGVASNFASESGSGDRVSRASYKVMEYRFVMCIARSACGRFGSSYSV